MRPLLRDPTPPGILARVSGITESLAEAIVAHRDRTGRFQNRRALLKVPRLGPKAFEQCAGFLRIRDSENPLDASGVHPEAYPVVRRILDRSGVVLTEIIGNERALRAPPRSRRRRSPAESRSSPTSKQAGPGGCGHQRRGFRGIRRCRRAPGRPGPRLGDG